MRMVVSHEFPCQPSFLDRRAFRLQTTAPNTVKTRYLRRKANSGVRGWIIAAPLPRLRKQGGGLCQMDPNISGKRTTTIAAHTA